MTDHRDSISRWIVFTRFLSRNKYVCVDRKHANLTLKDMRISFFSYGEISLSPQTPLAKPRLQTAKRTVSLILCLSYPVCSFSLRGAGKKRSTSKKNMWNEAKVNRSLCYPFFPSSSLSLFLFRKRGSHFSLSRSILFRLTATKVPTHRTSSLPSLTLFTSVVSLFQRPKRMLKWPYSFTTWWPSRKHFVMDLCAHDKRDGEKRFVCLLWLWWIWWWAGLLGPFKPGVVWWRLRWRCWFKKSNLQINLFPSTMYSSSPVDSCLRQIKQVKHFKWNTLFRAFRTSSVGNISWKHPSHFMPKFLR